MLKNGGGGEQKGREGEGEGAYGRQRRRAAQPPEHVKHAQIRHTQLSRSGITYCIRIIPDGNLTAIQSKEYVYYMRMIHYLQGVMMAH
jgi:hypothetical protein